jgi:hypothetical protein
MATKATPVDALIERLGAATAIAIDAAIKLRPHERELADARYVDELDALKDALMEARQVVYLLSIHARDAIDPRIQKHLKHHADRQARFALAATAKRPARKRAR